MRIQGRIAGLGGIALLGAWLAASASVEVEPQSAQERRAAPAQDPLAPLVAGLQAETTRLTDRLRQAPPSREPSRNLFQFAAAPAPAPAEARRAGPQPQLAAAAPAAPPSPVARLIGVAEQAGADGLVRTAVISGFGQLYLVKAGGMVGDRLRVERIGADAVELIDVQTGALLTIALR